MGDLKDELLEQRSQLYANVIADRLALIEEVMGSKQKEYVKENNVFHNFEKVAQLNGGTREEALKGMWLKHIVSVLDFIDHPSIDLSIEKVREKIGDSINYLIILEVMLIENIMRINEIKETK